MKLIDKIKRGYNDICDKTADTLQNITKDQIETAFGIASGLASLTVGTVVSDIISSNATTNKKLVSNIMHCIGSMCISSVIATATSKEIMKNGEDFVKLLEEHNYFDEEEVKEVE